MNRKFFELSTEKQQRILNAGYKVFSDNIYKKASMQLIADNAQISKSLLFHYFRNKQTLYEYLFQSAVRALQQHKTAVIAKPADFFELLENEFYQRIKLMEMFPYQYRFIMRVYDETCFSRNEEINRIISAEMHQKKAQVLNSADRSKFRYPEDLEILYDLIIDLSNGFYFRVFDHGLLKEPQVLKEFISFMNNLKHNYYKEEYHG